MSVILKRSTPAMSTLPECPYRCCSEVYGKNVKIMRRQVKQKDRNSWKKEAQREMTNG